MSTETTPAVIDTTKPVTREQYTAAIDRLLLAMDAVTDERGWCSERHRYFRACIAEYTYNASTGRATVDYEQVPEDTDYAARLNSIRRRALWYTKAGAIHLEVFNRFMQALGVPGYDPNGKSGRRFSARLRIDLNVAPDGGQSQEDWVYEQLPAVITAALDNAGAEAGRYVPGSAGNALTVSVTDVDPTESIPDSAVDRPIGE
jgi:hypothetical protein